VNQRSVLLRVWLGGSLCWVAYWIWHYLHTCTLEKMSNGHAIACRWETAEAGGVAVISRTAPALAVLWDMVARTFGIPACAFVAGLVLYWMFERFRRRAR
jgi:hypothetical protein